MSNTCRTAPAADNDFPPSRCLNKSVTFERENVVLGIHDGGVGLDRSALQLARIGKINDDHLLRRVVLGHLTHDNMIVCLHCHCREADIRRVDTQLFELQRRDALL